MTGFSLSNLRDQLSKLGLQIQLTKYSPGLTPFLIKQKLAKKIHVVYDVGAHNGSWTNQVSRILKSADFYLFEPNKNHNSQLEKTGFKYFNVVLSDQEKTVDWYGVGGLGDSYFKDSGQTFASISSRRVLSNTLNHLVQENQLPIPQLLKIDTQGSELDIIGGSSDFISQVKYVLLECPLIEYNLGAPNILSYLSTMQDYGFVPIDITEVHYMNHMAVQIDIAFSNANIPQLA
jgi:FkbM family methyltransferase